jgi:hypothetical protein
VLQKSRFFYRFAAQSATIAMFDGIAQTIKTSFEYKLLYFEVILS